MADWIPVYRKAFDDVRIVSLGEAVGLSPTHVLGHCAALWIRLSDHSPLEGKLSDLSDRTLEEWANWRGRRGRFAHAYREHFQTAEGNVRHWYRYVGFMLDAMERERKRKRDAYLRLRGHSAEKVPEKVPEKGAESPGKSRRSQSVSQSNPLNPPRSGAADRGPSGAPAAPAGDLAAPDEATRNAQADRLRQLVVEAGIEAPPVSPTLTPEKAAEIEAKRAAYKAAAATAVAVQPDSQPDIGAILRSPGRS